MSGTAEIPGAGVVVPRAGIWARPAIPKATVPVVPPRPQEPRLPAWAKEKLDGIESGAQANVIEQVSVNGTPLTPQGKKVDIDFSDRPTFAQVAPEWSASGVYAQKDVTAYGKAFYQYYGSLIRYSSSKPPPDDPQNWREIPCFGAMVLPRSGVVDLISWTPSEGYAHLYIRPGGDYDNSHTSPVIHLVKDGSAGLKIDGDGIRVVEVGNFTRGLVRFPTDAGTVALTTKNVTEVMQAVGSNRTMTIDPDSTYEYGVPDFEWGSATTEYGDWRSYLKLEAISHSETLQWHYHWVTEDEHVPDLPVHHDAYLPGEANVVPDELDFTNVEEGHLLRHRRAFSGKVGYISNGVTPGNLAAFDSDGNLVDTGYHIEDAGGTPTLVETT